MNQPKKERRHFHRIATDKPVELVVETDDYLGTVADISLRGLLVTCTGDRLPAPGATAKARIQLDDATYCIELTGNIVHVEHGRVGVRCTAMDLESAARLRRLVELNLADPTLLERELTELLAD